MTRHVLVREQAICETSFFVESIDETTRSAFRDVDCAACLRKALAASEQRTQVIRELLAKADNASYGEATELPRALCHGCSEMVEVVGGKLAPHHGESGDGCPLNGADAQIYLHRLVADRIAWLEAELVFGAPGGGSR